MSGSSPEEKVLNLPRLYVMCASQKQNFYTCGAYISCVDHQIKYFKNSESIYNVLITKENVLKLQKICIVCGSPKKMF